MTEKQLKKLIEIRDKISDIANELHHTEAEVLDQLSRITEALNEGAGVLGKTI